MNREMKPCPFCGKHPYMDGDDTLHPTTGWKLIKEVDCSYPVYFSVWDVHVMKNEHPDRYGIDFGFVYTMHCPEVYGGCGMQISGNSKEEAIEKWNRRMAKSELVKITGQLGDIYTFYGTQFRKGDVLYVQTVENS